MQRGQSGERVTNDSGTFSSSSRASSGPGPRLGRRSAEPPPEDSRQARLAWRRLWFRAAVHR